MKRTLSTLVALLAATTLILTTSACSDDSGGTPDGGKTDVGGVDGGGDTGGGDTGGGDTGGTGLTLPATATMSAGIGGTVVSAFICMGPAIGGGFNFSLQGNSASPCLGGQMYLIFSLDGSDYSVTAGKEATDAAGGSKDVNINSTSEGSVTQNTGGADEVTGLPTDKDITIGTASHSTVTFSFSGNDVTLKAFQ